MVVAACARLNGRDMVMSWLGQVMDPELPVLSVVDLGLVRDVRWVGDGPTGEAGALVVTVTPTYSGCPATAVIAQSIRDALQARGISRVEVRTQLSPAWTTDWLSAKGREALRAYGIAPPVGPAPDAGQGQVVDMGALSAPQVVVPCPLCGSRSTRLLAQFGSTACKALYRCQTCLEPFDYFKPH